MGLQDVATLSLSGRVRGHQSVMFLNRAASAPPIRCGEATGNRGDPTAFLINILSVYYPHTCATHNHAPSSLTCCGIRCLAALSADRLNLDRVFLISPASLTTSLPPPLSLGPSSLTKAITASVLCCVIISSVTHARERGTRLPRDIYRAGA